MVFLRRLYKTLVLSSFAPSSDLRGLCQVQQVIFERFSRETAIGRRHFHRGYQARPD